MIWYHLRQNGWDGPNTLADRVFEQIRVEEPSKDIESTFRSAMKELIDFSKGVGAGYDEIMRLLDDTGWSWNSDAADMPPGLKTIVKYNDRLAKLMMLRRLIKMYRLSDYEADIMALEISKQFQGQLPQQPRQQRRVTAEDYIRRHEEAESGRERAQSTPTPARRDANNSTRPAPAAGRLRRRGGKAGVLPSRDAGSRNQLPSQLDWAAAGPVRPTT